MKKIILSLLILFGSKLLSQPTFTINSSSGYYLLTCFDPTIVLTAQPGSSGPFTYTWTGSNFSANTSSVAVSSVAIYTVSITDVSMQQTSTQTVYVNSNTLAPNPQIVTGFPSAITCNNPMVLLSMAGSTGGSGLPGAVTIIDQWAGPAPQTTLASNTYTAYIGGMYTLTVHDSKNGCTGIKTIAVFSNTYVGTGPATYSAPCPGTVAIAPTFYASSSQNSYSWSPTAGSGNILGSTTSPTVIVDGGGKYLCKSTNTSNGCTKTDTVEVLVCVGIAEELKTRTKIYPNPSIGKLYIENPDQQKLVFELYDLSAKLIRREEFSEPKKELKFEYSTGLYFYKIISGTELFLSDKLLIH